MCKIDKDEIQQLMRMLIILFLLISTSNLFSQIKISELKNCLDKQVHDPKEYVLSLFEKNDIIIIGERDHRDTTQYDLILSILSDERFIENVGYVYTEVGCINRTDWANDVLKGTYDNEIEFEKRLIQLYRELDFNPLWEKYNMYKYLKGVYGINKHLEENHKITIGLTDLSFEWDGMNRKKYRLFEDEMNLESYTRDSIMAENFLNLYQKQEPRDGKRKALLIQSFPHAIKLDLNLYGLKHRTTGSYIVEKYDENVKIVAFNTMYFGEYNTNDYSLVSSGKWDAAFEMTGCKPIGFNVLYTRFGQTKYEDSDGYGYDIKYQEIIDGLIYYTPFYEFNCTFGIPNVIDKLFSKELISRVKFTQGKFLNRLRITLLKNHYKQLIIDYYNEVTTFQCADYDNLMTQMNNWLD